MQPETAGQEEQGPSQVPFVNDPLKPANHDVKPAEPDDEDPEVEPE
ncbi:hypothetical protein [Pseudomonas cremoricolorata]|nr:hypothetical protein [Pseudomonas cremoricolorata]